MTFNNTLADEVIGQIEAHPEKHNQQSFGSKTSCGTTLCFAGWTAKLSPDVKLNWVGPSLISVTYKESGEVKDVEFFAKDRLGLNLEQTQNLFYCMSNDVNVLRGIVNDIANGGPGAYGGIQGRFYEFGEDVDD